MSFKINISSSNIGKRFRLSIFGTRLALKLNSINLWPEQSGTWIWILSLNLQKIVKNLPWSVSLKVNDDVSFKQIHQHIKKHEEIK